MKERIVITGATGFIGKYVEALLDEYEVIRYKGNALTEDWNAFFQKTEPQYLIHLAWRTGAGYLEDYSNLKFLESGIALYDAFYKNGGKRAVFMGTEQEYVRSGNPLNEDSPIGPTSLYAKCKCYLGETLVRTSKNEGNSFAWCRLFFVYGPGEKKERLMPSLIGGLMNGEDVTCSFGKYIRDYVYVKDVASAIITCLFADYTGVVNISGGAMTTIEEIADTIKRLTCSSGQVSHKTKEESGNQPMCVAGDTSLLESLGWKKAYSLEEGLREEIEYLKG